MADEGGYRNPALAVDAVSVREGPRGLQVLLITQGASRLMRGGSHFRGVSWKGVKTQKLQY